MSKRLRTIANDGKRAIAASAVLVAATGGSAIFLGLAPGMGILPSAIALGLGTLGVGSTLFAGKQRKVPQDEQSSSLTPLNQIESVSKDVQLKIEELYSLAQIYERRKSPLFPAVNGVFTNVQELFNRMSSRLDEQSARLAAVRYSDMLSKLNHALGKSYYLDIEAHPELWSNPDERMEIVEVALNATGEQIIRNIRQLNASRDLIYQLSIDSLLRSDSEAANQRELGIS